MVFSVGGGCIGGSGDVANEGVYLEMAGYYCGICHKFPHL